MKLKLKEGHNMYKYAHVHFSINVWPKHGEHRFSGNRETDLIMKT